MSSKTIFFAVLLLCTLNASAQRKVWYTSDASDGSIFSLADVEMDGRDVTPILRWSPVFNFGTNINWDFSKHAGLFLGYNVRNVGLITRDSLGQSDRFKRRVYMIGMPLGIKLGNMEKGRFIFFGGEIGYPFHYKEKFFPDGDRDRKVRKRDWFPEQTEPLTQAAFVGFNFNKRFGIKAQYFFNNFFNQDYTVTDANGVQTKPFANYRANLFFVTLNFNFSSKSIWERKAPKEEETTKKGEAL